MNAESHPEHAIDRALAGRLSPREQQELERHLTGCLACSAHMALARVARTFHAPQPFDSGLNRLAVGNALASIDRRRWSMPFSVLLRRRRGVVLAAGILLGLGGVSSAAWWQHSRVSRDEVPFQSDSAPVRKLTNAGLSPTIENAANPAEEQPPPALSPALPENRGVPYQNGRSQPSAAALFEEASALRVHRKVNQAVAIFRKLQRLYPRARETRLSYALAGRLLLDGGRPAQALFQFDQHLAMGGEAPEEALAGRATALGRMGRLNAESETWNRLLEAYPRSVYGNQARDRLVELKRHSRTSVGLKHSRSASGVGRESAAPL